MTDIHAESAAFDAALAFTLRAEGGYVNDPDDPGGATNFGITQAVYAAHRRRMAEPPRPVCELTFDEASKIYRTDYWDRAGCNTFAAERPHLALAHFDAAVNMGVKQATKILQRAVGVPVDGIVGPLTIAAAQTCDEPAVIAAYLEDRARIYRSIAERRPASRKFLKGWLARCDRVSRESQGSGTSRDRMMRPFGAADVSSPHASALLPRPDHG
jgi:lysozyme family protein